MKSFPLYSLVITVFLIQGVLSTASYEASSSVPVRKRGRPVKTYEPNPYLRYTTISDLVSNRPHRERKGLNIKYKEAFSSHKDVQSIDLLQENETKLAQDFFQLRDLKLDSTWQRKMSITLKNYLKDSNVDDKRITNILGYHFGQRQRRSDGNRRRNQEENVEMNRKRRKDYYENNKEKSTQSKKERLEFVKDLDEVLYHDRHHNPEHRLSAMEIANKAEFLRLKYPNEKIFQPALKAYLKRERYSMEDIIMAQGVHSKFLEERRIIDYRARRRGTSKGGGDDPSTSQITHGKGSGKAQDRTSTLKSKGKKQVVSVIRQRTNKRLRLNSIQQPFSLPYEIIESSRNAPPEVRSAQQQELFRSTTSRTTTNSVDDVERLECGPWWEDGCFDE